MNIKVLTIGCFMLIVGVLVGYGVSILRPPAYHTITTTFLGITTTRILELFTTVTLPITTTKTVERTTTSVLTVTTTKIMGTTSVALFTVTLTPTYTVAKPITVTTVVNVDLLIDDDYYYTLLNILSKANKSIYIIMYAMKYDPNELNDPVNMLLYRVVNAYKRGLDVKVLLDDVTYTSYRETINYLKSEEVPIRLDRSNSITTHAKVVVVDDQYVFVGSHNWTESALKYNHEVTVLIKSDALAQQIKNYFEKLWNEGRTI
ncbi:MAG: phospholipase D-like domain-containing protein [Ignisphaera sp.]